MNGKIFHRKFSELSNLSSSYLESFYKFIGARYSAGGICLREGRICSIQGILLTKQLGFDFDPISFGVLDEMKIYSECFDELKSCHFFSMEKINDINAKVRKGFLGSGVVRDHDVSAQAANGKINRRYLSCNVVFEEYASFFNSLNSIDDYIEKAFFAHVKFVEVHPYTDGNGRISRLLLEAILYKDFGIYFPASLFRMGRNEEYLKSIDYFNDNSVSLFNIDFWKSHLLWILKFHSFAIDVFNSKVSFFKSKSALYLIDPNAQGKIESTLMEPIKVLKTKSKEAKFYDEISEMNLVSKNEDLNIPGVNVYINKDILEAWLKVNRFLISGCVTP
ncbi:Fic family protein [Gallaecimonas sp. GXIMD1310]|uniref:Fic family protein n=1 Tax=Gallaecimonas sp. GXIMD1310 TaxID=3131926 RepID=UPI0032562BAE